MTVRIGLLGCGAVARAHHLPALRRIAGAEVVAVADPDPARRALAGAVDAYAEAGEVLAREDVDAVVVTAPPALHAELAVAAAAAGKHVYVEKPLATTEADATRVLEEAARSGVVAAMGFNRRLHPVFERAHELIGAGALGDVRLVQTAFCEPTDEMPDWKRRRATGGGVLLDLGSHHFDLARWFLGSELEVVHARTSSELSEQDEAVVQLSTGSGVVVQGVFSFRAAHADFVEVFGEQGRLRVDRHRGALVVHRRRRSGYGIRREWSHSIRVPRRGDPSYRRSLEAFVRRVGGAQVETPTLDDGLRSLRLVLAAERAS